MFKHLVLIPDVSDVIPELLQDTLQDQLLPSEWQPPLTSTFGFYFYVSLGITFNSRLTVLLTGADFSLATGEIAVAKG